MNGLRETKVEGTPEKYYSLYTMCWDGDPDKRPTIQEVVSTLGSMISLKQYSIPLNDQQPRQESSSESSSESNSESNSYSSYTTVSNSSNSHSSYAMVSKSACFDIEEFDEQEIFVRGLVDLFIGSINKGKSYSLFRPILENHLLLHNITFEEVYKWLIDNHTKDFDFTFFIGYLNFSGNGTKLNTNKAFEYFWKASSRPIAQYYLGVCYEFGIGTKKDLLTSFEWYKKSSEETIVGKHSIALFYEKGDIEHEHNEKLAFDLYHETAEYGHVVAQHYLGNCYRLGIKVDKDYKKAFNYFSLSAEEGYTSSIIKLGDCYLEGIETDVDEKMAFELYLKAANLNDVMAFYNVGHCYENGVGTAKDFNKAREWYKKSADKVKDTRAIKKLEELDNKALSVRSF